MLPGMFNRPQPAGKPAENIKMLPSKFETLQSLKAQLRSIGTLSLHVPEPRVVCIGLENSGKSSVIERLINATIFPRDSNVCTRAPMLVFLRSSDTEEAEMSFKGEVLEHVSLADVLPQAEAWMRSIENVCSDEMHIVLKLPDAPTIDLVDLPGIVSTPADLARCTHDLSVKYARQPTASVLCVLESGATSVRSSKIFEVINDAGALDRSIGVFTKPDLIVGSMRQKLKLRLGETASTEDLVPLAQGYVAMCNRDTESLAPQGNVHAQRSKEAAYFKREGFQGLPVGLDTLEDRLRDSIDSLLAGPWRAAFLDKIRNDRQGLNQELRDLGISPISLDQLIEAIVAAFPPLAHCWWSQTEDFVVNVMMKPQVSIDLSCQSSSFSHIAAMKSKLQSQNEAAMSVAIQTVNKAAHQLLEDILSNDEYPLRIERFAAFRNSIICLLQRLLAASSAKLKEYLSSWPEILIEKVVPPQVPATNFDNAKALIANYILAPFQETFADPARLKTVLLHGLADGADGLAGDDDAAELTAESPEWGSKRMDITRSLMELDDAEMMVEELLFCSKRLRSD